MNTRTIFAETLASIDVAIVTKQKIDFDTFINESDRLCWLAMSEGDVVPSLYVNMIDRAFGDLENSYKGKYIQAYNSAVAYFQHDQDVAEAIEVACSPDYIGEMTEAAYMEYEANLAYADYPNKFFATEISQADFENCWLDSDEPLVKVVSNDYIDACHWIDTLGDLVQWRVKYKDNYYHFIGERDLSASSIMQIIDKKPH